MVCLSVVEPDELETASHNVGGKVFYFYLESSKLQARTSAVMKYVVPKPCKKTERCLLYIIPYLSMKLSIGKGTSLPILVLIGRAQFHMTLTPRKRT